eukprot:TRINITY_DN8378_c0_g1_i2.p1 TRINITY_DN8378_c0_g1~~TRINITY_DN8378_c0_g1_i2.p1  ORF type:complete len:469 (-),score=55.30 TRINITY_DN8378_c0_g1_i2:111-1517(-)
MLTQPQIHHNGLSPLSKLTAQFKVVSFDNQNQEQNPNVSPFIRPMRSSSMSALHSSAQVNGATDESAWVEPPAQERRTGTKRKVDQRSPLKRQSSMPSILVTACQKLTFDEDEDELYNTSAGTICSPSPFKLNTSNLNTLTCGSSSPYRPPFRRGLSLPDPCKPDDEEAEPKPKSPRLGRCDSPLSKNSPLSKSMSSLTGFSQPVLRLPIQESTSDIKYISPETMRKVSNGCYSQFFDKILVVDCRFPYEYEGGHIKDAINLYTSGDIEQEFMKKPSTLHYRICIIFHCEFSSHRGPTLYRTLRDWDRKVNFANYPTLFYPEIYVLEGGYKKFWENCPEICEPRNYVPMKDKQYSKQMKNCLGTVLTKKTRTKRFSTEINKAPIAWSLNEGDKENCKENNTKFQTNVASSNPSMCSVNTVPDFIISRRQTNVLRHTRSHANFLVRNSNVGTPSSTLGAVSNSPGNFRL